MELTNPKKKERSVEKTGKGVKNYENIIMENKMSECEFREKIRGREGGKKMHGGKETSMVEKRKMRKGGEMRGIHTQYMPVNMECTIKIFSISYHKTQSLLWESVSKLSSR